MNCTRKSSELLILAVVSLGLWLATKGGQTLAQKQSSVTAEGGT